MPTIVPAVLENNFESFTSKLAIISKLPDVKIIQIDFSDGIFDPSKLVLPGEIDVLNPILEWEAHLMVENPSQYFFDCKLAGFKTVAVHYEAISQKDQFQSIVEELRDLKIIPALAIKPETSVEAIADVADLFDQILVLCVHPGYQHQEMDPGSIEKVRNLRNAHKNVIIEVDGGVKLSNLKDLIEAGADLIVVGSALFDAGEKSLSPAQNFERFTQLLSETKENHGTSNIDTKTSA